MSTSDLTTTTLVFSDGANVNAQLTSSPNTFSLFSTNGANNSVSLENVQSLQFQGSTSGTFTQTASATTTPYGVIWPAAQATVAGQTLVNDSTGGLSWVTPTAPTESTGTLGDIQLADGAGNFVNATATKFQFTDAAFDGKLVTGTENGSFTIEGEMSDEQIGSNLNFSAGDTLTGSGGTISLLGGDSLNFFGAALELEGAVAAGGGGVILQGGSASNEIGARLILGGSVVNTSGGSLELRAGNSATNAGGNLTFVSGSGNVNGDYAFAQANTPSTAVVTIEGNAQNSTSTSTGTLRVHSGGGIGVSGDIFAKKYTATEDVTIEGSTSGTFTQSASATTAPYGVIWPAAQASAAGQTLVNDSTGVLSWVTPTAPTESTGTLGDVQLADGAGNFINAQNSTLNYLDTVLDSTLLVGIEDGEFHLRTLSGCGIEIMAGDGGSVVVQSGAQTLDVGDGGDLVFLASQGSVNGGGVSITTGNGNGGDGGDLTVQCGTGTGSNGVIQFLAPDENTEDYVQFGSSLGVRICSLMSTVENATSTTTGSVRVPGGGGIGVTGDIFAKKYTATEDVTIEGSISGTFTQSASATTTPYGVIWPAAQASVAGQVLANDSTGVLSWIDPGDSAGVANDVQLADGDGGFKTASPSAFSYANSTLSIGAENTITTIQGIDATTAFTKGGSFTIVGGDGNGNDGGDLVLSGGDGENGGSSSLSAGSGVTLGGALTLASGIGPSSGDISINTPTVDIGTSGSIQLTAGGASGVGGTGGNILLELSSADNPGGIIFDGPNVSTTDTFFFRDSASTNVVTIPSGVQNSTSTSTGSLRVPGGGGIGVTGDIFAKKYTATEDVTIEGSISGTFTQSASVTTTSYGVVWPAAQASAAGQVLANDSTGVLSWANPGTGGGGSSAGVTNDVQLADGSGGFKAASPNNFNFSPTANEIVFGNTSSSSSATIRPPDLDVDDGDGTAPNLRLQGGKGLNETDGGSIFLLGGEGNGVGKDGGTIGIFGGRAAGSGGNGGDVFIRGGFISGSPPSGDTGGTSITSFSTFNGTGKAGDITIAPGAPSGVGGTGGNLALRLTSGADNPGIMTFTGPSAGSATNSFFFRDSTGADILTLPSGQQDSTSTSTGSLRIPGNGGIGVSGSIYCTSVNAISDMRKKCKMESLSSVDCLNIMDEIEPFEYSFKVSPNQRSCGVLAQRLRETELLARTVVRGSEDTEYAIDYNGLVAILIGAIKELKRKVN